MSKKIAEENNIRFFFIYLPDLYPGWKDGKENIFTKINENQYRNKIFIILDKLNIDYIDMHEIFMSYDNPLDFLNLSNYGHYNNKGYQIVDEEIQKIK